MVKVVTLAVLRGMEATEEIVDLVMEDLVETAAMAVVVEAMVEMAEIVSEAFSIQSPLCSFAVNDLNYID